MVMLVSLSPDESSGLDGIRFGSFTVYSGIYTKARTDEGEQAISSHRIEPLYIQHCR